MSVKDLLGLINDLRDYRDSLKELADGPEATIQPRDYLYGKASGIDAAIASLVEYQPDEHDCPACDETFTVIDRDDWEDYAGHLRQHLYEDYVLGCSIPNEVWDLP